MLSINDYIYLFLQTLSGRPGGYPDDDLILKKIKLGDCPVFSYIQSLGSGGGNCGGGVVVGWWYSGAGGSRGQGAGGGTVQSLLLL